MGGIVEQAKPAVLFALKEDIGDGDVTSLATIQPDMEAEGQFLAKAPGVIAGLEIAELVYRVLEEEFSPGGRSSSREGVASVQFFAFVEDGETVEAGTVVARAVGGAQHLLTAERVALNFLQRMSGIATMTKRYVDAAKESSAVILDTRKTAPGLRFFDKLAVAQGGGVNHRFGLFDMALIKDNHIAAAGGITPAVQRVRARYSGLPIEVEVADLNQLREALALDLDRILLDNMTTEQIGEAVRIAGGRTPLEASGGVNLDNVAAIGATGVDSISVGALTHSVPALDISFDLNQ